jgi:hypothetical protein
LEDEIQASATEILAKSPQLVNMRRSRSVADPFVIALARVQGVTVVTAERASGVRKSQESLTCARAFEGSRALAAVGAFRIVPEHDLDLPHDTLENLHAQSLVELVDLGENERGLTLTTEGRDLLDSHSLERDHEPSQTFYAGVSRSREIDHDSNLYATFPQEEARLRDEHPDLEIRRIILEQDLKREYQEFLQEPNRDRPDTDGCPGREPPQRHPFSTTWRRPRVLMKRW